MTAAAADREAVRIDSLAGNYTMKNTVKIYTGTMVCIDGTPEALPAADTASLKCVGVAQETVDNADDGETIETKRGVFAMVNSSTHACDATTEGDVVYVEDDQTVATTSSELVKAGVCRGMYGDLVLVEFDIDVELKETRRTYLGLEAEALDGSAVYYVVSPVAGDITKIYSVLEQAALATGDATLTFSIGAAAVTGGVITITQAGSAVGDVDSATPTAANTVAVGDVIKAVVGGTNTDASAQARIMIDITS